MEIISTTERLRKAASAFGARVARLKIFERTETRVSKASGLGIVLFLCAAVFAPSPAAAQTWTTVAPLPLARYEAPNLDLNGKIYVFGGFGGASLNGTTQVHLYDPAANTWTYLTDIPVPSGSPAGLTHHGLTLEGDRFIWIAGGFAGPDNGPVLSNVWKYDVAANTWAAGPSLPAARGGGGLVLLGRELHYVGGTMPDRNTDAGDHWVLNLDQASPAWVSAAPLPTPRTHLSAVTLNGKIYTLAGQHNHDVNPTDVSVVEVYNPATNSWSTAANTPTVRSHFEPSTFVRDGRIVIVGGKSDSQELTDITEYDPLTNSWTALTPALPVGLRAPIAKAIGSRVFVAGGGPSPCCTPTSTTYVTTVLPRDGSWTSLAPLLPGRAEFGVTAAGGKVYVLGGTASTTLINTVSVYDPIANSWTDVAPLPGPARDHVGAATVDEKVYAVGGLTGWPGPSVANVYMYDPLDAAAGWVARASLPVARGAMAIGVINGRIYAVGGLSGSVAVNHLTVYDPRTDAWTTLAPMAINRDHLTAAVLDGKLYAIGERDREIIATTAATAVYDPATNAWTDLAPMLSARGSLSSGVLSGRIFVFGADTGTSALNVNEEYDPATNSWRAVTPMITARSSTGGAVIGGRIFAPGGKGTDGGHNLTVNEAFSLTGGGIGNPNQPPTVNAGPDKTVILPANSTSLTGTAVDDGLPSPPASLTLAWSVVSSPAGSNVTFSAPSSLTTTATFTIAGSYTLRLTASDSVLSSGDNVVVTVTTSGTVAPIRINAGGPAYNDTSGRAWQADASFSGGATYSVSSTTAIAGTTDPTLYRSERFGNFSYNIPVPTGNYLVTLHFAEIYWTAANQRVFNVSAEGQLVLDHLDIWASAGARTALTRTFESTVTDGTLNLAFVTVTDNAKISAIEVTSLGSSNTAPTISNLSDQTIAANASTGALTFTVGDSETAAGSLTVTGTSSNLSLVPVANIVFGGSGAARTVTVTSAANQSGSATITVTVSDGALTATDTFVLAVTPANNTAPTISDLLDVTIPEDNSTGAISFAVGDADTAAGSLTLTKASTNTALVPVANIVFGGTGAARTVTVTPAANQSGSATITVTVSDGALTATDTFVLTVTPVNDVPTISNLINQTIVVNTATGALSFTIGDVETAVGSLVVTGASSNLLLVPNANIVFSGGTASRMVTVTPAAGQTGAATITVTVSDGAASASRGFLLTVNAVPAFAPVMINAGGPAYTDTTGQVWAADNNFTGGSTYSVAATTAIGGTTDPTLYRTERFGNFSYSVPVPSGSYVVTLYFAEIYWTAANQRVFNVSAEGQLVIDHLDIWAQAGVRAALTRTFQSTVNDGTLNLSFATVTDNAKVSAVKIASLSGPPPTNTAPSISDVSDRATAQGTSTGPIAFTIGDAETAATSLTLAAVSSNTTLVPVAGIVFGGSGVNRNVTVTPAANQSGSTTITITVSDGALSASDTFVLTVTPVNNTAPSISDVLDLGTPEDTPTAPIAFTIDDAETPATGLTLTRTSSNNTLVPVASIVLGGAGANRNVTITPAANQSGSATITITVSDGALIASDTFILTVASVNDVPTISNLASQTVAVNTPTAALSFTIGDVETSAATLTLSQTSSNTALVPFANIVFGGAGASRNVTVTPAAGQTGTATITVTVSDGTATAAASFVLTVNTAPVFASVLINAGGTAYTDGIGQVWAADKDFSGGFAYSVPATRTIAGTSDPTLYRSERYGNFSYNIPVPNGTYEVKLHFAEIYWTGPNQRVFNVFAEGAQVVNALDIWTLAGANTALFATFEVPVSDGTLNVSFQTILDNAKLSALEVRSHVEPEGDPFLHVVIDAPAYAVDYDGSGSETVDLRGQDSHTHELGRRLVSWTWRDGGTIVGTASNLSVPLSVGSHSVSLAIQDDNAPPRTLTASVAVPVYPLNAVGGALAQYYPAGGTSITTLIDSLPSQPGFIEILPTLRVDAVSGKIGGSSYTSDVVASLKADYTVTVSGTYQFALSGGSATRFFLSGAPVSGPVSLAAGVYPLEARFALPAATSLPAQVMVSINGAPAAPIPAVALHHDETFATPFINSMPATGSTLGGESITIQGFGFFPSSAVAVNWGSTVLPASSLFVTPTEITLTTPPGSGTISVSVQTPNGLGNSVSFTYAVNVAPVVFGAPQTIVGVQNPTQAAWGPDGRLYVATISGQIFVYTLDDNYVLTNTQTISAISALSNKMILGIAFNPSDPPNPVRLYVAHSNLFANGGACFTGTSAYSGQVSRIDGPNFTTVVPVVTALPTSNHDHGVNGLVFDNNGDLLLAQGGNTNAGVAGNCNIGQLPESPLSAAILRAQVSRPGFNGSITYRSTSTGQPQNDQMFGETVDVAPGVDVSVWAPGFRNPFDLVLTTEGRLYNTDNGPNSSFGPASTSATTQAPDPTTPDQIERLIQGHYYGHPNRSRGRYFPRENVFRDPAAPAILGQYTAPLATVDSSSNGIDEYRATTFNSGMRGNLLVQKLGSLLYRAQLNAAGTGLTNTQILSNPAGLDVVTGPGGAILTIDYDGGLVKVLKPSDPTAPPVVAYDIFPWRGRSDGTTPFLIGGAGFGTAANTSVTVGGVTATLTSVSSTRIKGFIPPQASPKADLLDVVVQSAGQASTISRAFRYLLPPGTGLGTWRAAPVMPQPTGEVAGGVIDGVLYLVSEGVASTFAFDLASETWQTRAARPFPASHHAAEVINGKLYLFGGLDGAEGKVQIYNPATDSWTLGADAPVASGSAATALINGFVYMAGGIAGSNTFTTDAGAVYNPATNTWSSIANMPLPRNHAAAGTDGQRLFIFGGRGPGSGDTNVVAEGFDDVQIYDPVAGAWECSCAPASTIPSLPQRRGGMGKAVFDRGQFLVIGGETTSSGTGQAAGNVYNRVDVYDPVAKSWRLDAPLPTPRHGIFPLGYDGRIFVAGGGGTAGQSSSNVVEILSH